MWNIRRRSQHRRIWKFKGIRAKQELEAQGYDAVAERIAYDHFPSKFALSREKKMLIAESKARNFLCPCMLGPDFSKIDDKFLCCIGKNCMAWRWNNRTARYRGSDGAVVGDAGYCGLAGRPYDETYVEEGAGETKDEHYSLPCSPQAILEIVEKIEEALAEPERTTCPKCGMESPVDSPGHDKVCRTVVMNMPKEEQQFEVGDIVLYPDGRVVKMLNRFVATDGYGNTLYFPEWIRKDSKLLESKWQNKTQ